MAVYPERRNGKLTGKWIAEVTQQGERRRKRFETQRDGERWADFTKLTGSPPADETAAPVDAGPTLDAVAREALRDHPVWANSRDDTLQQRLTYCVDFVGNDKPVTAVKAQDIADLVRDLKRRPGNKGRLSAGTVNRYLSALSGVLTFAKDREYIASVPKFPWQKETGKRIHWLTEEAQEAVGRAMLADGQRACELCLRVLVSTGLRWGEFYSLTPEQVTEHWIKLTKTKTDTPRDVPILPELADELRALIRGRGLPSYYTFRTVLQKAVKTAGQSKDLTIHCLRHTTATRLIHGGVNLSVVKDFMGHSSINTTLKYTHVTKGLLQDALEKISPRAGQTPEMPALGLPEVDEKVLEDQEDRLDLPHPCAHAPDRRSDP